MCSTVIATPTNRAGIVSRGVASRLTISTAAPWSKTPSKICGTQRESDTLMASIEFHVPCVCEHVTRIQNGPQGAYFGQSGKKHESTCSTAGQQIIGKHKGVLVLLSFPPCPEHSTKHTKSRKLMAHFLPPAATESFSSRRTQRFRTIRNRPSQNATRDALAILKVSHTRSCWSWNLSLHAKTENCLREDSYSVNLRAEKVDRRPQHWNRKRTGDVQSLERRGKSKLLATRADSWQLVLSKKESLSPEHSQT